MRNALIVVFLFVSVAAFAAAPPMVPLASPSAHGILWTWQQSATPGITANALYCGTASGVYTFAWTFSTPTTSFDWLTTDSTHPPVQGQKYFCAVTAFTGAGPGIESGYSPEASGTFPVVPLAPPGLSQNPH